MSNIILLKCITCEKEYQPSAVDYTCPDCGPLLGTQEVLYDYDAVKKELTHDYLSSNKDFTHWRYLPLLPINNPDFIQPLSVGWTPIYFNVAIVQELGVKS
ncbi:MAG: threonine synthase, partial [Aliifodinibius sp.]|nr:threonine synthase [Fodinibius sp.]NIV10805.1 threonine synthase [Fodinibius sp.]NIY29754.1 threonine synthase [Fodinibius sp.]